MSLSKKGRSKRNCSESHSSSSTEDITQREELPGVDHKNKLGPRKLRHNKLNLTSDEGEARFLGSVKKELSKKSNIHKLQTAFQDQTLGGGGSSGPGTDVACKTVWCTNQDIEVSLSSPLDGITYPHYITNHQNKELVKDIPQKSLSGEDEDDDDGDKNKDEDLAAKLAARPSVIGVNLKWKHGITFKKVHKYTTKTSQLEPLMRKTEVEYETKTKFENKLDSVRDELFPEWRRKLMILDGNECHHGQAILTSSSSSSVGTGSKVARSERLEQELSAPAPQQPDPFCRSWKEYKDLEEHKILVIPYHSKNGFDMDHSIKYQLPYQAKFVIGRRAYHHKFMLQLPMTKAPQHYGLIFTFSEDPLGHAKFRVKSLISVYCLFPSSPRQACLETYEMSADLEDLNLPNESSTRRKTAGGGAAGRAAKNAVKMLSDNLHEDKLVTGVGMKFGIQRELAQPGEDCNRDRRLYRTDYNPEGQKQKKKRQIMNNIKKEVRT